MKYYQWYDPKVKVPKVGEEVLCVDSEGTFFVALYECREVEYDPFIEYRFTHSFSEGFEPGEPIYWMRFLKEFPEF